MAIDPTPSRQDAENISERVTLVTTKDAWQSAGASGSKIRTITNRVQSRAKEIGERARNMDETTVPDAFRRIPKYVSPRVHSWLDFAVSTYFLGLGIWF